jgi:nucleoside-diphosphate-sugar epimerase
MKNRVFISGAQGFVGRYLVAHWLKADPEAEILGVGRSAFMPEAFTHTVHRGDLEVLAPLPQNLRTGNGDRYHYLSVDIRRKSEIRRILREFDPDVVVNLASFLRGGSIEQYLQTNVEGIVAVVEAIVESRIEVTKLLIASTGGVYGAPADADLPLKETTACTPVDFYAASKLAAEHVSRILVNQHQIPTVWARLFNLIGAGQQEIHVCGRLATQIAAIISGTSPPLIRVGSLEATRDFVDIRDVAAGLEFLTREGRSGEIYNLGSGQETSIGAVLETFFNVSGLSRTRIERVEEQHPTIPRHFAAIDRLRALGFQGKHDLKQSVGTLLDYYLQDVAQASG